MRHYSKFHAILASTYSADLYRDVRLRWDGLGITYLFLLHVILITPALIVLIWMIDSALFSVRDNGTTLARDMMMEGVGQMPTLSWTDNKLEVADTDQPRLIHLTFQGKAFTFARIDLSASSAQTGAQGEFILLNRDGIHFVKTGGSIQSELWSKFDMRTQTLTQSDMVDMAEETLQWLTESRSTLYVTFGVFFWAFTVLALFIYRFIKALAFAAVGLFICSLLKTRIEYYTLLRIATVAITPALLVDILLSFVIGSGISFFMSTAITTGYMVFAIRSNQALEPQKG